MAVYENPEFVEHALKNTFRPEEVKSADYAAIYYTGGHGVMWDFPDNPELQRLTVAIYHQGRYVTSVCHGIAGLLNLKDDDGSYLISGKHITGFTTAEEIIAGKRKIVPFLNQQVAQQHGAIFEKSDFTVNML